MSQNTYDVLVIGSGIAGISLALRIADKCKIAVLSKGSLCEGASLYAQGGVAAVIDENDSIDSHVFDTNNAGVDLCDENVARFVAKKSSKCIQWLVDKDINFSKESNHNGEEALHLTKEGGHSQRRIVHAADATGREIETSLVKLAQQHKNIDLFENHIAIDLIKNKASGNNLCLGAYILDTKESKVKVFKAKNTVLATGGASKVYLYTSNPDGASGDGIAMAWRSGCRVANMEFNQFHPTCLYHPNAKSFLISEAVRGEGAKLILPSGEKFMHKYDPREELSPRDIVARAIDHEMKVLGIDHVYLDARHLGEKLIKGHFPNIYKRCQKYGFDMLNEPLPVVPAAHYTCGGVVTDINGMTDINGLYAVGEVAYTGLHGANRLASNSLMECLTFASSSADHIVGNILKYDYPINIPDWDESKVIGSDEHVVVSHNWDEIRRFMWDYVGIVRTDKRLERARKRIELLSREIHEYYGDFKVSADLIELRNLVVVADLIIKCAINRKESRGLHYSLDYPKKSNSIPAPTILNPLFS